MFTVTFDDEGRPFAIEGERLEEDYDPRYEHSGMYKWSCPHCDCQFTQAVDVVVRARLQHLTTGSMTGDIPICPSVLKGAHPAVGVLPA